MAEFYSRLGLNVSTYDLFRRNLSNLENDLAFYKELAEKTGGPVLELACGTGVVSWAMAEAGFHVAGLDLSESMLAIAEAKRETFPNDVADRVTFLRGDMTDFSLLDQYALIIVAFRSFQSILDPADQRKVLACIRSHLAPGGRCVIDLFDPRLDLLHPAERTGFEPETVKDPETGEVVSRCVIRHANDPLSQTFEEIWCFELADTNGNVIEQAEETLAMRWVYRQEMRYLFELAGLAVEAEYSDYLGSPPTYGKEQIWVVKKP
jgi:ubiquinone/menaquinone biosynthesis C-methylase UbiE